MIVADGHQDAADLVVTTLRDGVTGAQVYAPPIPTEPVAAPAILVQTPRAVEARGIGGINGPCKWAFRVECLVLSSDTMGTGLLALADEAILALASSGIQVQSEPVTYQQTPNTPAGLPAVRLIGE